MALFVEEFTGTTPAAWTQTPGPGTTAANAQDFSFSDQANLNFHTPVRYISAGQTQIRTGPLGSSYGGYLKFKLVLPNYTFPTQSGGLPTLRTRFGTFPPPGTGSSNTLGLGVEMSKAKFATSWSGVARPGWNTGLIHSFTADLGKPYYLFEDNGTDVTFSNSADGITYTPIKTWAGGSNPIQITDQILRWDGELTGWTTAVTSGWPNPAITTTLVLDAITWSYLAPVTEVTSPGAASWDVAPSPSSVPNLNATPGSGAATFF